MLGDPVASRAVLDAARRTAAGLLEFLGITRPGGLELTFREPYLAPPPPRPSSATLRGARYGFRSTGVDARRYGTATGAPPMPRKVVFSDSPLALARLQRGYRAGVRQGPTSYARPYTIPIPLAGSAAAARAAVVQGTAPAQAPEGCVDCG